MAELLTLRGGGSKSYVNMVEYLVQAIAGNEKWGPVPLMVSNKFCEQVTISNEVFTILVLENYKDKWDYRLAHYAEWKENKDSKAKETRVEEENKAKNSRKDESRYNKFGKKKNKGTRKMDQFPNPVETKWTMYDKSQHTKKFGGWQQAGIDRHNQLHKMVTNDRKNNLIWDYRFQQYYQQKSKDEGKYLSVDGEGAEAPVAVNTLWSTDPFGTEGLQSKDPGGTGELQSQDPGGIPYGTGPPAPDAVASGAIGGYRKDPGGIPYGTGPPAPDAVASGAIGRYRI
jgi:hypothetical protein